MVAIFKKGSFLMFLVAGVFTLSTSLVGCSSQTTEKTAVASSNIKTKVLRMGYQSAGDIVKIKGVLEKRLKPLGISVEWSKFAAGPQLLEAMNVGSVDFGSVGETPPIFAQASGVPFVYVASTKPGTGEGTAVVVDKDSSIKTVADLKGKGLAFQRATAQQYFVVKVLKEAGLKLSDVKHINLTPLETRAAFERKSVEAAVVGDPHLAVFQKTARVRILRDGKNITTQGGYWLGSRTFVKDNPELVKAILEEINNIGKWAENNPKEVAELISPEAKIDVPTLELVSKRRRYTLRPLSEEVLSGQQTIADLFYEQKFITKKINVRDAILSAEQYAAFTPTDVKP
ncbi:MAG: aliphatic sulfonate ABC transporter substrate-binding protein [Nostoc sp. DedVER02]|uniref:aliphatic sulfonate ABC transporter substrate-binding protein n=1 Tax=unclassified Nostoc TaxID=2593658 RepID=UPI002AD49155|nr:MULTISPECIES: aliphatic sulfonate ABC transporter substrate-binding protein [unclassified Nostoc]MDZ7989019.1 aliphatic sulfonate ABC transporter substrate-binding protein [Nostoc sp. DedVER02]MDZ8114814.1 aliphatic sulfonate ABC transporter substrate-binding protein [Nostoc sp. DedVER01b]